MCLIVKTYYQISQWGVGGGGGDPTDMQLMSRCRRAILLLLRVIDVFSKYEWAIALKD